ncbi:hypothetical protein BS47DRAFT_1489875 [Hydnum rufescens UP504]|uniref:3-hydroxyisobutyryl-CoA hydrolase n=1 Tax=Hydnum rufescens UP504 TaxID=1448309 RepID=A0A9P6DKM9_9AGAM|nr:hypothetical protein BS47DRAFT_1489875 [Hydnum rufescens UP504]
MPIPLMFVSIDVVPRSVRVGLIFYVHFRAQLTRALNALNHEILDLLIPKLKWDQSDLRKIVIARGNGPAFCAGGDAKTLIIRGIFQLDYNFATLSKPYVSVMEVRGGVGISARAPYRIATENTVFAMPETKIGCFPDVRSTYILARLDGWIETYLALTRNPVTSYEVFHLGLATYCISCILSVLERFGALEVPGPHRINEALNGFDPEPSSMLQAEWQLSISRGQIRATLDRAFASRVCIGRRPKYGAKIAERDYRLSDVLQRDLAINTAAAVCAAPDFNTGRMSVLVNKGPADKRPNWSPSTLECPRRMCGTCFSVQTLHICPSLAFRPNERQPGSTCVVTLPSENDIGAFMLENTTHGGVSVEEVVGHFGAKTTGKSGVRFKVKEVLARRC